jgi:hypothetical protein
MMRSCAKKLHVASRPFCLTTSRGILCLMWVEVDRFGWDVPARATFYKDQYLGDPTNWWVPTVKCLEDWCWCLEGAQKVEIIYPMLVPSRAGVRVWRTGG